VKSLEIRILGELAVVRAGRAVELPASKKTRALLAYLVTTGRPHLRERLCDLLWPGPDDPRAALRWSLTKIRALLDDHGATRILADRERVAYEPVQAVCDLVEVRAAIAPGLASVSADVLEAMAARFRGELLEGLDLPDAYRFHEWCVAEREAARAVRVAILTALVERRAGDPEAALRYARERVTVDPLCEAAHVTVVRLLTDLGRKREAQQQYETCARILANELAAKPSAAMLAARVALGGSTAPPAAEAAPTKAVIAPPPPSTAAPGGAPIVGRDIESATIEAVLARTADGAAAEVLVFVGDPGIGKSRMLEHVAARARARGGVVLRGRAFEAEMVRPYGAWIDALRSIALGEIEPSIRADLAPLLPELGGGDDDRSRDRNRLFDAVTHVLAKLAPSGAPLVVVLDDIQWFDEGSAALLHFAARGLGGARVLFACGARSDELADNAAATRTLRALTRDGRVQSIDLAPLDPEAIAELARTLDPSVDAARVVKESSGNPLFAIEVARALGQPGMPVAESLAALIADRLARLDETAREVMPWAAALGHSFVLETLERVTGMPPAALVGALEELERHGIVRASAAPAGIGYDFVHDLIRTGAYRQLSAPRRRLVHLQIARALSAAGATDGSLAGDVVHHAALAGDRELAARASVEAGERCLRLFANAEAARIAVAGLAHAASLARQPRLRLSLALWRVKIVSGKWLGEEGEVDRAVSRLIVEAKDAGLHDEAARGFDLLATLQRETGDFDGARSSSLNAAEAGRAADPVSAAAHLCVSARCLALIEREMDRADQMLHEARALAGERIVESITYNWGLGLLRRYRGDPDGARELLVRAFTLAERAEDHWVECDAVMTLVQLAIDEQRPDEALAWCAKLKPVVARMGEGSEGTAAEALEALSRAAAGERAAWGELERAIARLREIDAKGLLAYVLTSTAELDLAAARPADARARADEARANAEVVDRATQVVLARAILGRVALADGDRAAAARHLESIAPALVRPLGVSARARRAALDLEGSLATSVRHAQPFTPSPGDPS
jgi:DNA-binding SARP family transcriptional activator